MSHNVEGPTGGNGGAKADQVSKNDNLNNGDGKVHNKGSWNSTDSDRPKWTYETKHVATYDYRRADGRYSYSVLKGRNPDGRKTFKVMRRNLTPFSDRVPGDKSEWFGGQGGEPSVLYRLPELIAARIKDPGGVMVLILEGEKDVDTAAELGFVATTNPLGALKWEDSFSLYLAGTNSIVCPDADERGIEHAKRVAASVSAYAKRVRILRIPGYKDLTEWKEAQVVAGKTISEIAAELMVQIGTIKDVEETITLKLDDWLARDLETADYICGNWLTTTSKVIFTADTGLGKTLWSLALGLACAGGQPFMHWPASRPFRVLYVDGEMSRRVMKERLADAVKRLGQKPAGMHLLCHEDVPDGGWHPLNTPEGQNF